MSHYLKSKCRVRSRAGLVAALEELGFAPEVGDGVTIRGYGAQTDRADVVLRKVGAYGNDVGWREEADGSFAFIADSADTWANGKFGPAFEARLTQLAGVHADLATAASMGLVAERVDGADGSVDVYVYANE